MGEQNVHELDDKKRKAFTKALLNDVRALEMMLEQGLFETGIRRIGAEQEMFLIDENLAAAPIVMQLLERLDDPRLTTELAQYNLEANLDPQVFGQGCLRQMESELKDVLETVRDGAAAFNSDILLVGILPTLRRSDLDLDSMTPKQRYFELNRVMRRLRGDEFKVQIKGIDEFHLSLGSVMLEAANTSFQIHFQVSPDEFAPFYNVAQAISAPVLATAVNSPLLMGRRLWSETRIALFERSVDTRSELQSGRGLQPRVHFGDRWLKDSILEIFQEDITQHRSVLAGDLTENACELLRAGQIPQLNALRLHNGTIYRWNRPCYGVKDGVAHLRIEHRVLPAGPTVVDEVANAAFFFGLMASLTHDSKPIAEVMEFEHAKRNFFSAAQTGLDAQFTWIGGKTFTAGHLITEELLPSAREGLLQTGIDSADVTRYLDVIEERVASQQTGAQWALGSVIGMGQRGTSDLRSRQVTAAMLQHQRSGKPVHTWPLATLADDKRDKNWRSSYQTVGQIMTTDLFTVQPGDIVDLAASVMEWSHVRHVPVEDESGQLVGLLSHWDLLRLIARGSSGDMIEVGTVMRQDPVTVEPQFRTIDAIHLMRSRQVACLPVVQDGKLVGMITERDLIIVSSKLLEDFLQKTDSN
ncbi:MAG: CBS domain-containing protein [Myxococcota bacterium]|nr:CBS domain-containing protein [Myxococcota bacterium]